MRCVYVRHGLKGWDGDGETTRRAVDEDEGWACTLRQHSDDIQVGGRIQVGDSVAFRPLLRPLSLFQPSILQQCRPGPSSAAPVPSSHATQSPGVSPHSYFLMPLAEEQAGGQLARWAEDQGGVEGEGGRPYVASAGPQDTRTVLWTSPRELSAGSDSQAISWQGDDQKVATARSFDFLKTQPFSRFIPSQPPSSSQNFGLRSHCIVLIINRLPFPLQLCPLLGLRRSSRPGRSRPCRPRRRTRSDLSEPAPLLPRSPRPSVRARFLFSSRASLDVCSEAQAETVSFWLSFRSSRPEVVR